MVLVQRSIPVIRYRTRWLRSRRDACDRYLGWVDLQYSSGYDDSLASYAWLVSDAYVEVTFIREEVRRLIVHACISAIFHIVVTTWVDSYKRPRLLRITDDERISRLKVKPRALLPPFPVDPLICLSGIPHLMSSYSPGSLLPPPLPVAR